MITRQKIVFEYIFNTTVQSLYKFISTPEGLTEWFAGRVSAENQEGALFYIFEWGKASQKAKVIRNKIGEGVKFQWEEDLDTPYYFEMCIDSDELTKVVSLTITDFSTSEDISDMKSMWDSNMKRLKLKAGSK